MYFILSIFNHPRRLALALGLACVVALGGALVMQYGFGLYPCHLCVLQRIPYGVALALALALYILSPRLQSSGVILNLLVLTFAISSGLAGYHVGVEQGVFEGSSSCAPASGGAHNLDELRAMIAAGPLTSCKDVGGSFLGLSIAAWNGLFSLFLMDVALYARIYQRRRNA